MISNLGQLVYETCVFSDGAWRSDILILPRFTTGTNFFRSRHDYSNASLEFGELFDVQHFADQIGPKCKVAEKLPAGATYRELRVTAVGRPRNSSKVHHALRPGRAVAGPLAQSIREVEAKIGAHWVAIHLRIEKDWFFLANYCRKELWPRRCFTPTEVAIITQGSRGRANASGALLLYAEDLMVKASPKVQRKKFGSQTTKLLLNRTLVYTVRAAIEMFAAVEAPRGFYGNSFSTFTMGVSKLRGATRCIDCQSFGYDCGALVKKGKGREGAKRKLVQPRANASHRHLRVVDPLGCDGPGNLRASGPVGSLESSGKSPMGAQYHRARDSKSTKQTRLQHKPIS
eukprot:CAMPEP_0115841416 /NCGR_PEP_ID=MMETSP0287-20121206/7277_1 /TAXON_ID=412157 /ORGANISM="Chrysochromulina rotalis, Strain UIO044" /LENGTH=343 /DNA_ID=CAMNT_0003295061 /DNA_START=102 /DNA_END=1133 /DNA_ORIENTATION=+